MFSLIKQVPTTSAAVSSKTNDNEDNYFDLFSQVLQKERKKFFPQYFNFKQEFASFKEDYGLPENRLCYMYRNGPLTLSFCKSAFSTLLSEKVIVNKFLDIFRHTDLQLCSISCGPALDYIAFMMALKERCNISHTFDNVTIISKYGAWRNTTNFLMDHLAAGRKNSYIVPSFIEVIQGDLLTNFVEKCLISVSCASILIMNRTLMLSDKKEVSRQVLLNIKNVFQRLKPGCIVICIDNASSTQLLANALSSVLGKFLNYPPWSLPYKLSKKVPESLKKKYGCSPILSTKGSIFAWEKLSSVQKTSDEVQTLISDDESIVSAKISNDVDVFSSPQSMLISNDKNTAGVEIANDVKSVSSPRSTIMINDDSIISTKVENTNEVSSLPNALNCTKNYTDDYISALHSTELNTLMHSKYIIPQKNLQTDKNRSHSTSILSDNENGELNYHMGSQDNVFTNTFDNTQIKGFQNPSHENAINNDAIKEYIYSAELANTLSLSNNDLTVESNNFDSEVNKLVSSFQSTSTHCSTQMNRDDHKDIIPSSMTSLLDRVSFTNGISKGNKTKIKATSMKETLNMSGFYEPSEKLVFTHNENTESLYDPNFHPVKSLDKIHSYSAETSTQTNSASKIIAQTQLASKIIAQTQLITAHIKSLTDQINEVMGDVEESKRNMRKSHCGKNRIGMNSQHDQCRIETNQTDECNAFPEEMCISSNAYKSCKCCDKIFFNRCGNIHCCKDGHTNYHDHGCYVKNDYDSCTFYQCCHEKVRLNTCCCIHREKQSCASLCRERTECLRFHRDTIGHQYVDECSASGHLTQRNINIVIPLKDVSHEVLTQLLSSIRSPPEM